jgi:preprotein translocase subunit SecF
VLVIGAEILGAYTLQYFGLALVIGLISGAYSSIFIASPILSQLKEREPRYRDIRQRLANRDSRVGLLTPLAAAQMSGASDGARRAARPTAKKQAGTIRPASRSARPAQKTATTVQAPSNGAAGGAAAAETVATNGGAPTAPSRTSAGGGPRPQGSTAARRPPPRPRKGKGKGKGGRRR